MHFYRLEAFYCQTTPWGTQIAQLFGVETFFLTRWWSCYHQKSTKNIFRLIFICFNMFQQSRVQLVPLFLPRKEKTTEENQKMWIPVTQKTLIQSKDYHLIVSCTTMSDQNIISPYSKSLYINNSYMFLTSVIVCYFWEFGSASNRMDPWLNLYLSSELFLKILIFEIRN